MPLIGGGREKRGGEKNILERVGKLGQWVLPLDGGLEPHYELWVPFGKRKLPVFSFLSLCEVKKKGHSDWRCRSDMSDGHQF